MDELNFHPEGTGRSASECELYHQSTLRLERVVCTMF